MKNPSLFFVSFLQALGLSLYCSLIGLLMIKGNQIFGPTPNVLGPTLFLILFIVSAIICALIFLGYPFIIFWEQKNTTRALKLIVYSTTWLSLFIIIILSALALI